MSKQSDESVTASCTCPNANQEVIFLNRFLTKSRLRPGTTSGSPYPLPVWVQPKLIKEGQDFIQRHFFSIYFAHFISLLFLLCYQPVRLILLQTGKSDTGYKALKRYFSTLLHIRAWYEGDLIHQNQPASNDIHHIKKVHAKIGAMKKTMRRTSNQQKKQEEQRTTVLLRALQIDFAELTSTTNNNNYLLDLNTSENEPKISQLDMCVTQFCFMGFLSMYPKIFGIFEDYEDGLKGFIHLWALIGHLIGIEENVNLGLESNAFARPLILKHVLIRNLQNCDQDTIELWKSLSGGIGKIIPFISLKAILLYVMQNLLETDSTALPKIFNVYDKFCFRLMGWSFDYLIQLNWCRSMLNGLLRLSIFLTEIRLFGRVSFTKGVKIRKV